MRLFIGTFLNSSYIIGNYTNLFNKLTKYIDGKWVEPHNLHFTYNFLGEVEDEMAEELIAELNPLLKEYKDKLEIKGITGFPNVWKPKQLVCKILNESHQIFELQKELTQILKKLHFKTDERPYTPHLTLVRVKNLHPEYSQFIKQYFNFSIGEVESYKIELIKSELTRSGPVYSKM